MPFIESALAAAVILSFIWWLVAAFREGLSNANRQRRQPALRPGLRTATQAADWHPGWYERYTADWRRTHGQPGLPKPGYWARGDDGIDAFITDTPDWDRAWFKAHDMLLPRFGDSARTYWRDYGGGLSGLSYRDKTF